MYRVSPAVIKKTVPLTTAYFSGFSFTRIPGKNTGPVLTLTGWSLIPTSGPERPPDGDRVPGAEIVAQKTHAAELAFFRVNTVSFYPDKYAHRT
jgi:hypothetical protein